MITADRWRRLAIKEAHVQRAVLDYLGYEGILAIRLNAGEAEREGRRVLLAPEGTPDIVAQIPTGRRVHWHGGPLVANFSVAVICWIECKRPGGGRLRLAQKFFRARAEGEGALYIEARSLDDVMRAIPPKRDRARLPDVREL